MRHIHLGQILTHHLSNIHAVIQCLLHLLPVRSPHKTPCRILLMHLIRLQVIHHRRVQALLVQHFHPHQLRHTQPLFLCHHMMTNPALTNLHRSMRQQVAAAIDPAANSDHHNLRRNTLHLHPSRFVPNLRLIDWNQSHIHRSKGCLLRLRDRS